ncbi:MAG: GNAT family N-acetyltransferase [Chitinophagaceae bacterium]
MKKTSFTVRPMQLSDIGDAMKLSKAEGWNQTETDWKILIANSGNICVVAESDNKIIGTTTAINYSDQLAWIGMVLVEKEYRGEGISKSLLSDVFKKSAFFKSIKLDATPAGQPVYKKFGFTDEYLIARMTNASIRNLPTADDSELLPESIQLNHIREIIALDEIIFGANRTQLIQSLIKEYPAKAWLLKRGNNIAGFALGRAGNKYHHIGPIVASNTTDAITLMRKALRELNTQPVVVDVLSDKEELIDWLSSIGFIKQRHFIRMYKNENYFPGIIDKQYLIAGPEFG